MHTLRAIRKLSLTFNLLRFHKTIKHNVRTTSSVLLHVQPWQKKRHIAETWHSGKRYLTTTSTETLAESAQLDNVQYDRICTETLDALCDYFDELVENATHLNNTDVSYGDGVLTVKLGGQHGTYVINRQTPNKQIWLSSPTSGPKRYDFVGPASATTGKWIYKHTGESMHDLLQSEIEKIFKTNNVDFTSLPYGK